MVVNDYHTVKVRLAAAMKILKVILEKGDDDAAEIHNIVVKAYNKCIGK